MNTLIKFAEQILRDNKRRARWRTLAVTMAAIVVFTTTYALILPAITIGVEDVENMAGIDILEEAQEDETLTLDKTELDSLGLSDQEAGSDPADNAAGNGAASTQGDTDNDSQQDDDELLVDSDSLGDLYASLPGIGLDEFAPKELVLRAKAKADKLQVQVRIDQEENKTIGEDAYLEVGKLICGENGDSASSASSSFNEEDEGIRVDHAAYQTYLEKTGKVLTEQCPGWVSSDISLYDIAIYDEAGDQLEPAGEVRVKFTFDKTVDAETIQVLHFIDGRDFPKLIKNTETDTDENGKAVSCSFRTDSFSKYAIVTGAYTDEEPETETDTEAGTEEASKAATEVVTELTTEAAEAATAGQETENIKEAETELKADGAEETETELQTEHVEETETELQTEHVEETATELITERAEEAETEQITEHTSEVETEREVEAVTEGASEPETEIVAEEAETEVEAETTAEEVITEAETETVTEEAITEDETETVTEEVITEAETESVTEEAVTEAETEELETDNQDSQDNQYNQDNQDAQAAKVPAGSNLANIDLFRTGLVNALITTHFMTADGKDYVVTVICPEDAGIPDNAEIEVSEVTEGASVYGKSYADYVSDTENALGMRTDSAEYIRLFDIKIVDPDDHSIQYQPAEGKTVDVRITLSDTQDSSLSVVHFAEGTETGDVVENITKETRAGQMVAFEAEGFSVYAIVGTVIEKTVLASDGNNYRIIATYGSETGIPANADLEVNEILPTDQGGADTSSLYGMSYEEYVAYTENALGMEEGSAGYIRLFDIKIVDRNDSTIKYQPVTGTKVDVRIELADAPRDSLGVVHFVDGSDSVDIVESVVKAEENGRAVTFETEGFSVYVIVDKGPIRTYSFYAPDASGNYFEYYFTTDTGESVYQQRIKTVDGVTEEVIIPQLPSIPGSTTSTFAGWYVYDPAADTYSAEPFDFENIPAVTEEEEIILRAKFADYAYVVFHEQYNGKTGKWPVAETRRGEKTDGSAVVEIDDVTVTYDDTAAGGDTAPLMAFHGWSLVPVEAGKSVDINGNPVEILSGPLTITENVDLYPVFVPINWLTFSSGPAGSGATYVPPRYYYADEGEDSFPIPVRTGYTFDGWYTAEEGGTKIVNADGTIAISGTVGDFSAVDGELRISEDATLYGHWTEAATKYTVVVWRQKVTDEPNLPDAQKTYDFAESFTLDTVTGSTVNVPNAYKQYGGSGDYTGFHYDRCDDGKMAVGNGSTVLNVYYDRNVHTLTFRSGTGRNATTVKTITDLYGSSIKDEFPITGYNGYQWSANNSAVYSYALVTIETMPDADATFTPTYRGTQKTIYYYVEIDDESESTGTTRTFNGKLYTLYKTVNHNFNFLTYDEEYHPLEGYIRSRTNASPAFGTNNQASIGNGNVNYLYYDRDTFEITFKDSYTNQNIVTDGSEMDPVSVKYNQKIINFVPDDPVSTREGYRFTGWYADAACSTRVYFTEEEYNNSTAASKVLYDRMPANNLQLFAGWETEWYLIEIDPNGGVLTGTQSTWFWEPYNGDPIEEYTLTARDYQESLDGTWYYAIKDRDYYGLGEEWDSSEDSISARGAYYTQDISDPAADLSKRYEYAKDAYRKVGWYEVHEDGSETLYAFGQPVMHNTKLRLHWKQIGTYYLRYDAGEGVLDDQDSNEEVFHVLDDSDYTDHANVVITRTANPPEGKCFIGWTIRGGDGTIYYPGQTLEYQSIYAVEESVDGIVKDYLILDPVYSEIGSAKIIYDANGGSVNSETVDYGAPAEEGAYSATTADENTATISGLLNNSEVTLSTGAGFTFEGAQFTGWNTKPDATGEHFEAGENYYVDKEEPVTLYAEWQVKVYFDKNNANADWGGDWDVMDGEGNRIYTWDEERQQYYTYAYINGTVEEPEYVPVSSNPAERFAYWSPVRYTDSGDVAYPYDFSAPIEREITLYGFWANAIQVPYHVVDASEETLEEVNNWKKQGQEYFVVNTGTSIPLGDKTDTETYVNIPAGYDYAFACVSDSLENCSEDGIITDIGYNTETKRVSVTYANGTTEDLPSDKEIYLVYFENPKTIPIDYKLVNTDESLTDVEVPAAAPTSASAGSYNMTTDVNTPLGWANDPDIRYYSYAIGDVSATNGSQVHVITNSAGADALRPPLQIRNTWRGFQYSTDNGSTWTNYGYDPELYVLYYPSEPTLVTIHEDTIGTLADLSEEFTYDVEITTTTTTSVQTQTRTRTRRSRWSEWGEWSSYNNIGSPSVESSTESVTSEFTLSDGQSENETLFYTSTSSEGAPETSDSGNTQTQTRTVTTTTVTQTITVTQRPKDDFTTTNDGIGGDQVYVYTYTTTSSGEDQEVTYTNTRTQEDIELYVALAVNGGISGADNLRTEDADVYTVTVPNGQTVNLSETEPAGLFTGDTTQYRFAGIIYGKDDGEGNITSYYSDVNSVSFAPVSGGEYLGVYMNGDPEKLLEDGYNIYYVYYPMPKIVYMQEGANGALTAIDPIERNGQSVVLNGETVAQENLLSVGNTAFIINQTAGGGYRVPPDLDGHSLLSLDYVKIGAGTAGAENIDALDMVSDQKSLQLMVQDGQVKWSTDGNTWEAFTDNPTVYIIYKEKGYDLNITKTVNSRYKDGEFDLVISSSAITQEQYTISGYEVEQDGEMIPVESVEAIPAAGEEPGIITLKIKDGSNITISALQHGTYSISEVDLTNYEMESAVVGGHAQTVTENAFSLVLNGSTTADITNIPVTVPIKVIKTDQEENALEGAVVCFTSDETFGGEMGSASMISCIPEDGTEAIIIEDDAVPLGIYTLHEETAPTGYLRLESDVTIDVKFSDGGTGQIVVEASTSIDEEAGFVKVQRIPADPTDPKSVESWVVMIKNNAGVKLPATGGPGTKLIYLLGIMLTAFAGASLVLKRKRKI